MTLPATKRDAEEMRTTFHQFDYDIIQLKNEAASKPALNALAEQLKAYLRRYDGAILNADGGRKVIIFAFSGHGMNYSLVVTNDGKPFLLEDVMEPLAVHIPKLLIINFYSGGEAFQFSGIGGSHVIADNYRIDCIDGGNESTWMPMLAHALRERDDTYSNIMAKVNHTVHHHVHTLDQLSTLPIRLYFKKEIDLSGMISKIQL